MTTTTDVDPTEVGEWMLLDGLVQWEQYDDNGVFEVERLDNGYSVYDPDEMEKPLLISFNQFFFAHKRLIWNATIDNYRHDWIEFAFKSKGAEVDEYDANTCDAVLQNMLYKGKVIYG